MAQDGADGVGSGGMSADKYLGFLLLTHLRVALSSTPRIHKLHKVGAKAMTDTATRGVQEIRKLRARGFTIRAIAQSLNERGIPAARGGRWWPKTVRTALG